MSNGRFLILSGVLVLGITVSLAMGELGNPFASTGYKDLKVPFSEFPRSIGAWTRSEDDPLTAREQQVLGQDRYLRRVYFAEDGSAVRLFLCYYGNKDRGLDSIFHNPTICLPAAGWDWVGSDRRQIALTDAALEFEVSIDRFRDSVREVSILNFFILDGKVLGQTPRNTPFRLALEKIKLSSDPGYFVQAQVLPLSPSDGAEAREAAVAFLEVAGSHIFRHFWREGE